MIAGCDEASWNKPKYSNIQTYGSLVDGNIKIGTFGKPKQLVDEMKHNGIKSDIVNMYTSLIDGNAKQRLVLPLQS